MTARNRISRQAARFARVAARAWNGLEQNAKYYIAFADIGRDADAEEVRVSMHASVDAWCDAQRSKAKAMGGQ